MSNAFRTRAWIEVDCDAMRANYRAVRRAVGNGPAVIAMVKADGYGLGAERVVRALDPLDPWAYGVAAVSEAAALRTLGVTRPILVFSPLSPQDTEAAAALAVVPGISDLPGLDRWAAQARDGRPLEFHVEVDTGMGRAGFDWRDTSEWGEQVRRRVGSGLRWTGIYTHFHSADAADPAPTETQWRRFQDALAQLPVSREDLMVHACNSAAALRWPRYAADAVRPGIFLYGGDPFCGVVADMLAPRPVAALRARLVLTREAPPGSTAGYGATHVARGWERWGTLAIGYGDGLRRTLGNHGSALVRGQRVPIIGRISMDMTVVDISAVPGAVAGDIATLIGRDGDLEIALDEVAGQAGTIGYEILTGLTQRLPRLEESGGESGPAS